MRLFNKTIDRELFKQYALGSDLAKQDVVVKIFNPVANGRWYILNSDPEDPDYLWAIVDLGYGAEVGSVSRNDLETYRGRFGLGFERDLSFDPVNALELYNGLIDGKYYAHGGEMKGKDTWQNIFEEFGFKKGRSMYGLDMYYKKGYIGSVDHELRNVELMFEDDVIYKGFSVQGLLTALENQFGKRNFADGGEIEVVYERRADFKKKPIKLLLLNKGREQKGYTFSGKDQVAVLDNYNRNKQEDLERLWNLKGYETKYADGGSLGNYDVVIDGDWDEPKKFKTFSLAKKWIYENAKNYESLELVDPYGDTIFVEGNSTKEDLDWLFSNDEVSAFAKGGNIAEFSDNQRMIMNQNVEVEHHHEELEDILEDKIPVPAWVVAKMETATQNLSDITHYLDGQKEIMEDQLEGDDDDDDDDEMEMEEIENKEVVEPIVVTAGDKTEITKNFTDDAFGNLKGFLKGMEGVDLRDDYTFDYKGEQFEVEPIINSDDNGVSNAVFTIFNGDGEEQGEITYSREGGKQKFTANSELFSWNNAKFEDGGFMNGVYAKGGIVDVEKVNKADEIYREHNRERKEKGIENFSKESVALWNEKYNDRLEKLKLTLEEKNALNPKKWYADGGYFDGAIPKTSSYMSNFAKGGEVESYRTLSFKTRAIAEKNKKGIETYFGERLSNSLIKKGIDERGDDGFFVEYSLKKENYAKGGEIAKAEILGLKRNRMGTTDIEMKITGMRKPQDFIVYPIGADDAGNVITIQSDTRIGQINLVKGFGVMSQSHSNGAYFVHLQMDKLTSFTMSEKDLKDLKDFINKTSGANVGTRGIVSDNSGASGVYADGGEITDETKKAMEWWGSLSINQQKEFAKNYNNGYRYRYIFDYAIAKNVSKNLYYKIRQEIWENEGKPKVEENKKFADGGFMADVYADGGGVDDYFNKMQRGGSLEDKLVKLKNKKSDLESKLFDAQQKSNAVWNNIGFGAGMRRSKVSVSTSREDSLKERIKVVEKEIQQVKQEMLPKKPKYILKADIKTVTVKRKGKEVTYNGADVLNGAHVLAKGGDITSKANYVGKNDVVEVELKDGSKVKPANGYWIKKGAEPVGTQPTPTSSGKSETKVGETYIRKDMRNNWKAETNVDNFNGYDWRLSTIKTYSGKLVSSAQGGKTEPTGTKGYEIFKYTMYEDPNYTLEVSTPKRLTEKLVSEQHDKALAKFKKFMETGTFKGGGKISNFDKLSAKVAKNYEGKPVKSQYQEEYGKYYSKEEAQEVGDKVAGKVKAMTADKKVFGGLFSEAKKIMTPSKKYPDLSGKQGLLKSGKYVQVYEQDGNKLSVKNLGEIGLGTELRVIDISEVDIDSFKAGGQVAGKVKAMTADKKVFGGLFSEAKKIMTPSKKYPDLSGKQGLLKSGKYVQVYEQDGNKLSVKNLGEIGLGTELRVIDISEVDIDSFKAGGQVAGKVKAMQPAKKEMGGETKKMSNGREMLIKANQLAKEIRKDGESWNDAKKRAFAQLKK